MRDDLFFDDENFPENLRPHEEGDGEGNGNELLGLFENFSSDDEDPNESPNEDDLFSENDL